MYKYSVIVPVYNSEKTICRCIQSVLNQTYSNWELILVNDGSTDSSGILLKEYSQACEKMKIIHQENSGPGAARNNGLHCASGDYVVFLDADDYYDADYLESIDLVNRISKKDVVFIDYYNERQSGEIPGRSGIFLLRNSSKAELISRQMTGVLPWGPCVKAVSADIVRKCSFSALDVGEEAVFSFDVLNQSETFGFVEEPKYHYVYNLSGQHTKGGMDPWRPVVDAMGRHLKESGRYEEYRTTLNSFALRAMCISLYRISNMSGIADARKNLWAKYKEYRTEFDFRRLNYSALDKTSVIILMLLKCRMFSLIYLLSKYKAKIASK